MPRISKLNQFGDSSSYNIHYHIMGAIYLFIQWYVFLFLLCLIFTGYTVAHPSLTKPIKMTGPPLFANIEHFEEAVDFETVKAAMLRYYNRSLLLLVCYWSNTKPILWPFLKTKVTE